MKPKYLVQYLGSDKVWIAYNQYFCQVEATTHLLSLQARYPRDILRVIQKQQ